MSAKAKPAQPFAQSILLPTDFSDASSRAFAQALAMALAGETKLIILHAGPEKQDDVSWSEFPSVRRTLEAWNLLEPNSPRHAVYETLGFHVAKYSVRGANPVQATIDFMQNKPVDLVVLATSGRESLAGLKDRSTAEAIARWAGCMTLFVPLLASRGVVSIHDGSGSIRNILVPVDRTPSPRAAVDAACRMATTFGDAPVKVSLLHVGRDYDFSNTRPSTSGVEIERITRHGDTVTEILKTARALKSDLIVMGTCGHDGVGDALWGSTTEQVMRTSPCPLLAVPGVEQRLR